MDGDSSRGAPAARRSFGIGARMAMLVCALVAVIASASGVWNYLRLRDGLLREESSRQQAAAELIAAQLVSGAEALRQDVAFLAAIPAVGGIVRAAQAGGVDPDEGRSGKYWRERLVEIFEAEMRTTPEYFQIRLIGIANNGRELVRVERRGRQVVVVPDESLQEKVGRSYFQESMQSPPGAVLLSRIDLNEEHGEVSEPHIATLRAATVIAGGDGKPFGLLVINKDLRPRFAGMKAAAGDRYSLYVFDENLDLLVHPDPSRTFGFQLGKPVRITQQFPDVRRILFERAGNQALDDDLDSGQKVIATLSRVQLDPGVSSRSYGVLLTAAYQDVIAASVELRNQTIGFVCLLMAVTVPTVLLLSGRLTRPLAEITRAVQDFARGGKDLKLPLQAGDEAGVLARAFDDMFRQVARHEAEIEAEVVERRRTEAALRQSKQRLRLALKAARAGAWEWDLASGQTMWDESLEQMAAIDRNTFHGALDSWLELMHPEDVGNVPEAKRRTLEENQPYEVEFRIRGPEGDWRHWNTRGDLVRDQGGRPLKLVGISWDVTEAKQAQEQIRQYATELERKNREMEQFVYSVSHDLKSPLVTCKGFTGILKEDLADGRIDEAMNSAERVERATQHMGRLIEDLLQLSRVGRVTSKSETVQVSALVSELAEELRLASKPGVRLEIEPDMPDILTDPLAVSRLFQNLLANALQYGCAGPEPRIEVGSLIAGGEVRYFVRDNGPGIAPEYHEKVFGLFQRLEANQGGTGIGLAIVSKIMEVHGGRVWIESAPGEGATFWLGFPSQILARAEPALPRSS
jgi:PAS domain S-box-containing protein